MEGFPSITPNREVNNLLIQSLYQHLSQLQFHLFQILWSQFATTNMLKLLVFEFIDQMFPQGWRYPH